jgi:Helix-turn-helix domain
MTKTEQTRLTSWRLKILQRAAEDSRNVARTCRHFGISRQAFYKISWSRPEPVTSIVDWHPVTAFISETVTRA